MLRTNLNRVVEKISSIASILLLVVMCVPASGASADDAKPKINMKPVELVFSTYNRQTADPSVAGEMFMKRVTERTGGLVKFRAYYAGAMGSARELFPYTSSGAIQVTISRTAYYPGKFELATIDELPYTGFQMDARQKAYLELTREFPDLVREFTKQNLKYLAPLQSNAPCLFSKVPITKPEDFHGLKFRAAGSSEILIKKWGGTPVTIPSGDIYEAISRGLLNGSFGFPAQTGVDYGLQDVAKYFINTGTGALGQLCLVMNLDTYNKLPKEVQKIIDEEAVAMSEAYPKIRSEGIRKGIKKAVDAGVHIVEASDTMKAQLEELARPDLHEKWVKEVSSKGVNEQEARTVLKRMIELYNKYAKESTFKDFWALYRDEYHK